MLSDEESVFLKIGLPLLDLLAQVTTDSLHAAHLLHHVLHLGLHLGNVDARHRKLLLSLAFVLSQLQQTIEKFITGI